MKILLAQYPSPDDFVHSLRSVDEGPTTVQVKTKARYEPAERVILEIGFPGLPNRVLIRALSMGHESDEQDLQRFQLEPDEEAQRDFLIAVASGGTKGTWQRRNPRFPMRMAAQVRLLDGAAQELRSAEIVDLATGGVALVTRNELPNGALVIVALQPGDGTGDIEVPGRVVWNRSQGDRAEVGVQFESLAGDAMKRLRQIIRGVKTSGETLE